MIRFFSRIIITFLTLTFVLEIHAQETGEDETSLVSRFDIRYMYQDRASDYEHRVILRSDKSLKLNDEWALGTRVDLPLRYNDRFNALDNPNGDWKAGVGDVLLQGFITRQRLERIRWGTGIRTVLPTATGDQFGTGKWQLGVGAALAYDMPEISKGSYMGLTLRNQFDIAGDSDRNDIHELVIEPKMRFNLGGGWAFITAPDIRINLENDNELFVPVSGQISYSNATAVYSMEVEQAIVDDFIQFDTRIEFRIGFFY